MAKNGYTLLEVSLFLAISGGLALIAFLGLGPRLRNVQFTDAMRSVESRVNQELASSDFGQNERSGEFICKSEVVSGRVRPVQSQASLTANNPGQCVMNGRMVYFTNNQAIVYSILSLRQASLTAPGCSPENSLSAVITCHAPILLVGSDAHPVNPASRVYVYKNGIEYSVPSASPGAPSGFGVIRDPRSNTSYRFAYKAGQPVADGHGASPIELAQVVADDQPHAACFTLSGRSAHLNFAASSANVTTLYDEECPYL